MRYLKLFEQVEDWEDPFGEDSSIDEEEMKKDIIEIWEKKFPNNRNHERRMTASYANNARILMNEIAKKYNKDWFDIYHIVNKLELL